MNYRPPNIFIIGVLLILFASNAYSLERLFTTPAERARLDSDRLRGEKKESGTVKDAPQTLTVNGLIIPRKGKNQVWVNGTNLQTNQTPVGFITRSRKIRYNQVPLHLIGQSMDIVLRPGETYFMENGSKKDAYQWVPQSSVAEQTVDTFDFAEKDSTEDPDSKASVQASSNP